MCRYNYNHYFADFLIRPNQLGRNRFLACCRPSFTIRFIRSTCFSVGLSGSNFKRPTYFRENSPLNFVYSAYSSSFKKYCSFRKVKW